MSDKQAKLAAALRKRPSDDDVPPPLVPTRGPEEVKLRKSNLKGTTSWEQCLALLELNLKHEYAVCVETVTKMLTNITSNPSEPKFRKIRVSNPGFAAKVYSMKGAPELFTLVGFKDTVEEGFLVLPDGAVRLTAHTDPTFFATPCTHAENILAQDLTLVQPNPCPIPKPEQDLAPVQRAIDSLAAQQTSRREEEEKQRQLRQRREREARELATAQSLTLARALSLTLAQALSLTLATARGLTLAQPQSQALSLALSLLLAPTPTRRARLGCRERATPPRLRSTKRQWRPTPG